MGPLPVSVLHCCVAHALHCRHRVAAPPGPRAPACRRLLLGSAHPSTCRGCGMNPPSKDEYGEPRQSTQLRKLTPINRRSDLEDDYYDDDDYPPPRAYRSGGRSPSPRRVRFSDDEEDDDGRGYDRTPGRTRPVTPAQRRTPGGSAAGSQTQCCCQPPPAARRPAPVARSPSACSCGSAAAAEAAEDVQFLYPESTRAPPPSPACPEVVRHACSVASRPPPNPCSFSVSSVEAADSKPGGGCGPCAPQRRLTAEDLVERRQPSWWEPALSRVLSVVVSTVLLLATGGAQPSAEHLTWTKDFLRCVKDRAGNPPPNVAALLAFLESLEAPAKDRPAEPASRPPSIDNADRISRTSRSSRVSL